jgi:hypothetical protein
MSEGYRRARPLREIPPGQHRHATPAPACAAARTGWTPPAGTRYNGTRGSWYRAGFDTHAITRGLLRHNADTPHTSQEDPHVPWRVPHQFSSGLLDKAKPDWPQRLDLAAFDMSRPGRSVLVQLFGSMDRGLAELGIAPGRAAAYGVLDIDPDEVSTWQVLITRLVEDGPSGRPPLPPAE